ncbi:MAG: shikimate dehydrogenase [Spirochaetales bacterium]|nr:shikimate dehydrogenase [Spirochaetales bacterium]
MNNYSPAVERTMYFIGVTTTKSSIMKVFPKWADHLGLDAVIKGFDFEPHSAPELYREAVDFIKKDPLSLGALVTTHKLDLVTACKDRFEGFGEYASLLGEISSISKRENELWGHAKDPITSGLSLEAIVPEGYWKESGSDLHLIGAGGSSLALSLYLINKKKNGGDIPVRIVVSNRSAGRLEEMKKIHAEAGTDLNFEYILAPEPKDNDTVVASLKPGSMIVNATGLGKDRPGSPLTDNVVFPENGIVWEFNYRGNLVFLDQANSQKESKSLNIHDGWTYFIHGWTRVIAEVFHIDIPTSGPEFDKLSEIAAGTRS